MMAPQNIPFLAWNVVPSSSSRILASWHAPALSHLLEIVKKGWPVTVPLMDDLSKALEGSCLLDLLALDVKVDCGCLLASLHSITASNPLRSCRT